ncbi:MULTISPECIES: phage Gp37/Gp68 family protein [unclassified Rhizobium]|uniref:phage Gp37/Gp68 family protein n=1 Tax=unclassified Rhizobium TaxID=2613769 RepID=UPI00161CD2A0|nr:MULTISPECIES: phage Gp37/Gp68 family protein [unclassified Rhizobium]MBB3297851.1 protein gp37 [Rhizobium sp. BK112]MBB4177654.1 protein gp37 [Rhizobium sp. BK109]
MADGTKIEWTDATWNPITGCSVVSPGCTNCYAMKLAGTRLKHIPSRAGLTRDTKAGPVWTGEVRFNEQWLDEPLRWKRPRMIFVCAHGDLFAEGVPDDWIDRVFAVMALSQHHIFQVLTKRPERMRTYVREMQRCFEDDHREFSRRWGAAAADAAGSPCAAGAIEDRAYPLPNVWLGVSVEDQKRADERIPILLDTPAAIRWISAEPMLGPIDLNNICFTDGDAEIRYDALTGEAWVENSQSASAYDCGLPFLDWIVAGGESGTDCRPMHPHWAHALRDQCYDAGAPFLFKQWGNWIVASHDNGHYDSAMATNDAIWLDVDGRQAKPSCDGMREPIGMFRVTKSRAGRLLDGVEHNGYPPLPAHFKQGADQ